ncbi:transposase [Pedobacter gandavensis]|uniref:transposase n=1 Tax=Pedobacter gandavensis TaxID=2679963 RepID=UPI0039772EE6
MLRLINRAPLPHPCVFTAINVDDWVYKKWERYGSIRVNLTTRRVVDLLPDREEKSSIIQLQQQPKFEVITRDNYGKYSRAAIKGAPQAMPVTDHSHLLKTSVKGLTVH